MTCSGLALGSSVLAGEIQNNSILTPVRVTDWIVKDREEACCGSTQKTKTQHSGGKRTVGSRLGWLVY